MSIETNLKDVIRESTDAAIKEFMSSPATREEVQASIRQLEADIIAALRIRTATLTPDDSGGGFIDFRRATPLERAVHSILDRIDKLEHLVRTPEVK